MRSDRRREIIAIRRINQADAKLFSGPVHIGPELRGLIDSGEPVKSAMTGRKMLRGHGQGILGDLGRGNIIVLYDLRAMAGRETADVIRQRNGDIRCVIRRGSPHDSRTPVPLDVDTGTWGWESYSGACQRILADEEAFHI